MTRTLLGKTEVGKKRDFNEPARCRHSHSYEGEVKKEFCQVTLCFGQVVRLPPAPFSNRSHWQRPTSQPLFDTAAVLAPCSVAIWPTVAAASITIIAAELVALLVESANGFTNNYTSSRLKWRSGWAALESSINTTFGASSAFQSYYS